MARRFAPWSVRAGALLAITSFFLPQFEIPSKPGVRSPFAFCVDAAATQSPDVLVFQLSLHLAPLLGGLLLLGAWSFLASGESAAFGWALSLFFVLWAFLVATMGSMLATMESSAGAPGGDETGATVLLFATPLILVAVVLARLLGGRESRSPRRLVTAAIGILLLVQDLHALQSPFQVRWLAGALAPLLGAGLIVAGAALAPASPARPESVAASGAA